MRAQAWKKLTRNSDPPSAEMARMVVKLIDRYANAGIGRYDYRLPMFPEDTSWHEHEGQETPPSTAVLLGYKREDFVKHVE